MAKSWEELDIPGAWTATAMLRSLVADNLGPNKTLDASLDEDTRQRMIVLGIMSQLEVADKVAQLIRIMADLTRTDTDT